MTNKTEAPESQFEHEIKCALMALRELNPEKQLEDEEILAHLVKQVKSKADKEKYDLKQYLKNSQTLYDELIDIKQKSDKEIKHLKTELVGATLACAKLVKEKEELICFLNKLKGRVRFLYKSDEVDLDTLLNRQP